MDSVPTNKVAENPNRLSVAQVWLSKSSFNSSMVMITTLPVIGRLPTSINVLSERSVA